MSEMGIETIGLYNGHSSLALRKNASPSSRTICQCCPYGYHIDLGFVEFCDRLAKESSKHSPTKNERRERRRQRQSMEVLLGLANPMFWNIQQLLPTLFLKKLVRDKRKKMESSCSKKQVYSPEDDKEYLPRPPAPPPRNSSFICDSDGLKKAVQDFEATLERTTKKGFRISSEVLEESTSSKDEIHLKTASAVEPIPKYLGDDVDSAAPLTDTAPLQNIREQMAVSLEKMKEMEYQVKALPWLEEQVTSLEAERNTLLIKITQLSNALDKKTTELEKKAEKCKTERKVTYRDVSVLCTPKTRDVGSGNMVTMKTSFTETDPRKKVDKATGTEKLAAEESKRISLKDLDHTQEIVQKYRGTVANATQTIWIEPTMVLKVTEKRDIGVQSDHGKMRDVGIIAKPKTAEVALEKKPITRDIATSEDTINDLQCDRCKNIQTRNIGVGFGNVKEPTLSPGAGLTNRSKSFDFSKRKDTRSIGVSTIPPIKKLTATKQVGTVEISVSRKHIGVNTTTLKTRDAATIAVLLESKAECQDCKLRKVEGTQKLSQSIEENQKSEKHESKEDKKKGSLKESTKENTHTSKIPRPTGNVTPVMNRKKFLRQDTYSKTLPVEGFQSSEQSSDSRLKQSPEKSELPVEDPVEVTLRKKTRLQDSVAEVEKIFSADLSLTDKAEGGASASGVERYSGFFEDGAYDYDDHYGDQQSNRNSQMFPENALFQPIQDKSRNKLVPSKEMKAAMKVVNDGLHKYPNGLPKHLKTASSIIQQEWFKISSTASANPLDVEDYLDNFEEVSSTLLEYVVNMVDNNGNTAMHYAVSHGNFDVVSILLDSKVCNINKANAAGYTCVMLVSLAQVRSDTHRQVVRRLFLLADVNVRAKQHGQTALMLAVSHGRLDMVQLLLGAGADPNIQDCDGSTALMCAAEHGHLEIVKQILGHPDCDPSIVDCDGSSALAIAMEAGNRDIGVLLYAREHFAPNSRGSSPYTSFKQRRNKPSSSPHPKTPTSPGPAKRSDHSF